MLRNVISSRWWQLSLLGAFVVVLLHRPSAGGDGAAANKLPQESKAEFAAVVKPLLKKYCLDCHSTKARKGSLDLERFATLDDIRKDVKPWQGMIEQIEAGEMPPKNKPQPTDVEKKQLIAWVRGFMDAEARARVGDPGHVPLRRLSNAEYDRTIRDLTGVDLRPTREFPADGAAGEGFTNAAEALSDISPALLSKYLNAAKDIADHAVLLPDGFRFSPTKTRRDWTDESLTKLREFFADYAPPDGKLPFAMYLEATVRHRDALLSGKSTVAEVARTERLHAKYLGILWRALTDEVPSYPLDSIRARWRTATEKDVPAVAAEVSAWQAVVWKFEPVGSYRYGHTVRQVANNPAATSMQALRLAVKPTPGQSDVTLFLVNREVGTGANGKQVVWQRPRFEAAGKPPLLLRDFDTYGAAFEVEYPTVFANCAKYLGAVAEAAHDRKLNVKDLAKRHGLDAEFLKRWIDVLAVEPLGGEEKLGRVVPPVPVELLDEKVQQANQRPALNGWKKRGAELPILVANSSGQAEQIPGRVPAHGLSVHPTPQEFVAVAWKSPIAGSVRVSARIAHAHPACGNGVAWWLEHRRGERATIFAEGALDLGKEAKTPPKTVKVAKGDTIFLAVDARDANHVCDMTELGFTLTDTEKAGRTWDLAADVADSALAGNPHADKLGQADAWSFVRGPSRAVGKGAGPVVPPDSLLGLWRDATADPNRRSDAAKLADQVQTLLSGPRPAKENDPNRTLYDRLVSANSVLFAGVDAAKLGKRRTPATPFALRKDRFTSDGNLVVAANSVTEIRLPAALLVGREFVVEGKLAAASDDRASQFLALTSPPAADLRWDGKSPVVAKSNGTGHARHLRGLDDFRQVFPLFVCFPRILPDDEVVCLKMYHREDEHLTRLFLNDDQARRLDRLWLDHRFISRQPVAENDYLPQFIGYVTQDQPKELLAFFEGQRPVFKKRADEFLKDEEAAVPKQLAVLLDFAARAYRRPLSEKEKAELLALYQAIRRKGAGHEEAFRGVLARVLVAPDYLFRIEQAPPGKDPAPVNDWELASRLSYFLWSSMPDDELRKLAAAGKLRDPDVLAAQTRRMLQDPRLRSLAIEFGTQWIHVRGIDELKEKNESLFPTFDAKLRRAVYEESILFFQDLFQGDRPVTAVLDADHTFLNDTLAKHYGIPDVTGPEWRRVDGVRRYGRGGILGLASVQAKQSGASRTSPVLRGNWVVETLLGEKLPKPPPNVPQLPEEEGAGKLTVRQQVERHAKDQACAVCHVRIDPFGFALEKYDTIGRLRDKDLGGLAVETKVKLRDGTEFDGIDGLRTYLLTKKRDVIVRLFCKRLLGYALGRAVTLSDTALLNEMVDELNKSGGRVSAAVLTIVRSPQFRMVRGTDFPTDH